MATDPEPKPVELIRLLPKWEPVAQLPKMRQQALTSFFPVLERGSKDWIAWRAKKTEAESISCEAQKEQIELMEERAAEKKRFDA